MKLSDALLVGDLLAAMKISRLKDEKLRYALIKWFLATQKFRKEFNRERDEIVAKFRSDWSVELAKAKVGDESAELVIAKAELTKTIEGMLEPEVTIDREPVDAEPLYDPDLWGADDTLGQIANTIDLLVKHGVAKEE